MQRYSLPKPGDACCAGHTTSDNQRSCARPTRRPILLPSLPAAPLPYQPCSPALPTTNHPLLRLSCAVVSALVALAAPTRGYIVFPLLACSLLTPACAFSKRAAPPSAPLFCRRAARRLCCATLRSGARRRAPCPPRFCIFATPWNGRLLFAC